MPLPVLDTGSSRRGSHRVSDWSCHRYFAYRELLHLRPVKEPEAKAVGTVFHIGGAWRDLALMGDPRAAGVDPVEMMRCAPPRVAFAFEKARELFEAWRDRWKNEQYRPVTVEREFAALVGGFLHTQRFDTLAIWQTSTGPKIVNVDRKTAGGELKYAHLDYARDLQTCSAELFGRNVLSKPQPHGFGIPWGGTMLDFIGKRDPIDFRRVWLTVQPLVVEEARQMIAETNAEIEAEAASGKDPWEYRCNLSQCRGRYGWCEFLSLCQNGKRALDEYVNITPSGDAASEVEG